ncbi:MAG: PH domain-containing protein [Bryobacteraceae bacterium]
MSFQASYDLTAKIVSLLALVVAFVAALASRSIVIAFLLFLGLCLAYAYSAREYVCEGRSVIVKRLVGDVTIPLDGLREARAAAKDDFCGCMRLWGNGGLFGYYGLFRTTKLGKCTWYVTNRKNAVVLVAESKTVLLSPDDASGFLGAIGAFVAAAPVTNQAPLVAGSGAGRLIGMIAGGVIGAAALAFALFCVLYSPGAPRTTLDSQSLEIHDLFYPVTVRAADVDVERIRVVDFAMDADWRPTARTNGFANGHYRSGWFRVANGEKVRMYRADGTRLVLLPPRDSGAAVLVEVQDPERFAAELRRLWSRP